ncbi:MAG: hypothetical protein NC916_02435 [Candidatus Omnitrophica bacterium]|nr:hypothetical protein [Candidatus Omnitrophota bacterium]
MNGISYSPDVNWGLIGRALGESLSGGLSAYIQMKQYEDLRKKQNEQLEMERKRLKSQLELEELEQERHRIINNTLGERMQIELEQAKNALKLSEQLLPSKIKEAEENIKNLELTNKELAQEVEYRIKQFKEAMPYLKDKAWYDYLNNKFAADKLAVEAEVYPLATFLGLAKTVQDYQEGNLNLYNKLDKLFTEGLYTLQMISDLTNKNIEVPPEYFERLQKGLLSPEVSNTLSELLKRKESVSPQPSTEMGILKPWEERIYPAEGEAESTISGGERGEELKVSEGETITETTKPISEVMKEKSVEEESATAIKPSIGTELGFKPEGLSSIIQGSMGIPSLWTEAIKQTQGLEIKPTPKPPDFYTLVKNFESTLTKPESPYVKYFSPEYITSLVDGIAVFYPSDDPKERTKFIDDVREYLTAMANEAQQLSKQKISTEEDILRIYQGALADSRAFAERSSGGLSFADAIVEGKQNEWIKAYNISLSNYRDNIFPKLNIERKDLEDKLLNFVDKSIIDIRFIADKNTFINMLRENAGLDYLLRGIKDNGRRKEIEREYIKRFNEDFGSRFENKEEIDNYFEIMTPLYNVTKAEVEAKQPLIAPDIKEKFNITLPEKKMETQKTKTEELKKPEQKQGSPKKPEEGGLLKTLTKPFKLFKKE